MKKAVSLMLAIITPMMAADVAPRPLSEFAKITDAVEIVFVTAKAPFDGEFEFVPKGDPIKVAESESKLLKNLEEVKVGELNGPLVGDLGVIALKNGSGEVVAILGVDELGINFWIAEATMRGQKIVGKERGFFVEGKSLEFSRWMYAALAKRWPAEMKKWEREQVGDYGGTVFGRSVLEQIALLKNGGQQADADNPAAAPESNREGKDKPKPESE